MKLYGTYIFIETNQFKVSLVIDVPPRIRSTCDVAVQAWVGPRLAPPANLVLIRNNFSSPFFY